MTGKVDGGYYAIKGFLYQFDRTLIEILRNPTASIAFENHQDIDYEDYVLQVKHKETQSFSRAKIRKAVAQLLATFAKSPPLCFVLYCYFADQPPHDWAPTLGDLDEILGSKGGIYPKELRERFLEAFVVRFSEDYESQFTTLLGLIRNMLSLRTDEEAVIYHSLFHSYLLKRSIHPKRQRRCTWCELVKLRHETDQAVFYTAYARYLGQEKYEAIIRRKYFRLTAPNLENFERLFTLEVGSGASRETAIECIMRLSRKYFRKGKSPQPYICLHGAEDSFIDTLKQRLVDQGVGFFDGTNFDGDRFRLDALLKTRINDAAPCLKFVPEFAVRDVVSRIAEPRTYS